MKNYYPCPSCKELVKMGHPQEEEKFKKFVDLVGYCNSCHLQFEITFEQMEKYQRMSEEKL